MFNSQNMYDYMVIGTLHSDENIEVLIAYKGVNDPDNLYILNKIPFNKKNSNLFKKFFFCFTSEDKIEDFEDMFVFDKNFYVVYKYKKCESIKFRFSKEVCVNVFEDRCSFIEKVLIKLDRLSNFPIEAFASITDPNNICIDSKNKLHVSYNLSKMFSANEFTMNDVYKNIYNIVSIILEREAEVKYNKSLHVVLERCKNGLYASIPELAVDLKEAEKISKSTGLISYIKYRISLRKGTISKVIKYSTITAVICGLVYLGYSKIFQNTASSPVASVVSIGDISYNGNSEDESSKNVSTEKNTSKKEKSSSDISLSPGLDIEYEDYIVQYGDTISSICENYYKDATLSNAVSTFNDMEKEEKLIAGTILKLPNKTAIALYVSN